MELKMDFPAIQTRITEDEAKKISEAILNAKSLSMGPYLKEFEDNFATFIGTKYASGVSNATAALDLAAIISGIKEGEEVIIPAHTFTASALPFLRRKAKIIFCDIDPETLVMDIDDVASKITSQTRAIVAVHLYGLPAEMDKIMELARKHDLFVIEDCAQSPGAEYKGQKVGTFGHCGCFSFHGQKNITTLGEGGMLTLNDDSLYEQVLGLRKIGSRPFKNQEKYWKPAMSNVVEAIPGELPYNFALGEIQAFAGNLLLKRIDQINGNRKKYYKTITESLKDYPELVFQKIPDDRESAFHLLPARYVGENNGTNRDDLIEILYSDYGIKCVVQYVPLYRYELFNKNGYTEWTCPESDRFFDTMISFPFKTVMSNEELDYLINSIKSAISTLRSK